MSRIKRQPLYLCERQPFHTPDSHLSGSQNMTFVFLLSAAKRTALTDNQFQRADLPREWALSSPSCVYRPSSPCVSRRTSICRFPEHSRRGAADPAGVRAAVPECAAVVLHLCADRHYADSLRFLLRVPHGGDEYHKPGGRSRRSALHCGGLPGRHRGIPGPGPAPCVCRPKPVRERRGSDRRVK